MGRRAAEILEVAEELLAELEDTAIDEYPRIWPEDDELPGADTFIAPPPVVPVDEVDILIDDLETVPTPAIRDEPPMYWIPLMPPVMAPVPRSRLGALIDRIRGWFR